MEAPKCMAEVSTKMARRRRRYCFSLVHFSTKLLLPNRGIAARFIFKTASHSQYFPRTQHFGASAFT